MYRAHMCSMCVSMSTYCGCMAQPPHSPSYKVKRDLIQLCVIPQDLHIGQTRVLCVHCVGSAVVQSGHKRSPVRDITLGLHSHKVLAIGKPTGKGSYSRVGP